MSNYYTNRDLLKSALSIPATATGDHTFLDAVLEGVSRNIDTYLGFHLYPASGTRYYRPTKSTDLALDYPLTNIDSVTLDTDGDSSYESTLDSTAYWTRPYNATEESPCQPWWGLELREDADASACFPVDVARGAKIDGTWGYYNERDETTAAPATDIAAADAVWDMTGASNLHPGQTILIDSEQVFIVDNGLSGSATALTSGEITVERGQNGSTATTHAQSATMSIYKYPVVDQACLYQSEMDFRAKDAPMGIAGAEPGGGQRLTPGGLHPFIRRMLDAFRMPEAK